MAYWKKQRVNPMNDKGNLFDPFTEMVLPRTLSQEEVSSFLRRRPNRPKLREKILAQMMQKWYSPRRFPDAFMSI